MSSRSVYIANLAAAGDEAISLLSAIMRNHTLKDKDRILAADVLLSRLNDVALSTLKSPPYNDKAIQATLNFLETNSDHTEFGQFYAEWYEALSTAGATEIQILLSHFFVEMNQKTIQYWKSIQAKMAGKSGADEEE